MPKLFLGTSLYPLKLPWCIRVHKTVYLVDYLFDNSDRFMDQLDAWFSEHLSGVRLKHIKPRESWVDDPEMRAAVGADGDAALLGVGL